MRAELEREAVRLKVVKEQVRAIEAARARELAEGKQPLVAQLVRLRAIGAKGAWVLVKEVFGWRHFANRRELAGSLAWCRLPTQAVTARLSRASAKQATAECAPCWSSWLGAGRACNPAAR